MSAALRQPFWLIDFSGLVLDERPAGMGRELLVQYVDVDGRAVLGWRRDWEVLPLGVGGRIPDLLTR